MLSALLLECEVSNLAGSEKPCAIHSHADRQPAAWRLLIESAAEIREGLQASPASPCCKYICIVMAGFPHLYFGPLYHP